MAQQFNLVWEKLTVISKEKFILDGVSGYAASNSLVAIMGPSGAGKTTLLGSLAGRRQVTSGYARLNNEPITGGRMKSAFGYLPQDDIFTNYLTVTEHLQFMSALKLRKMKRDRENIANALLKDLNLDKCKQTQIRLISGGEKRRLALATELLCNPHIIFCDEPITGLDSFAAMGVIKILHALRSCGKLVVITVHQPSSQIFDVFTHVLLLADGRLAFHGTKEEMTSFFSNMKLYCPKNYNSAEFYVKCVTLPPRDYSAHNGTDERDFIFKCFEQHQQSREWQRNLTIDTDFEIKGLNFRRQSVFIQLYWLLWRGAIDMKRRASSHFYDCSFTMLTAFLLGLGYSAINAEDVQNVRGLLFFVSSEIIFQHMYSVIFTFPLELPIFLREKNLYSAFPYFISKFVLLIPRVTLQALAFVLVIHLFVDYPKDFDAYMEISAISIVTAICASALGLCLSAVCDTLLDLQLFIVPFQELAQILCGAWGNLATVPSLIIWIKYISPFFYSFEAFSVVQWEDYENEDCQINSTTPCYATGSEILAASGLNTESKYTVDILYMLLLTACFCLAGFIGIVRKRRDSAY